MNTQTDQESLDTIIDNLRGDARWHDGSCLEQPRVDPTDNYCSWCGKNLQSAATGVSRWTFSFDEVHRWEQSQGLYLDGTFSLGQTGVIDALVAEGLITEVTDE